MTVIVAVTFFMLMKKDLNILVKLGMVGLCVLQGIARVNLHYHTYEQVFGGIVFGTIFALVFFKLFDLIWSIINRFVPSWLNIHDDLYEYTPVQKK